MPMPAIRLGAPWVSEFRYGETDVDNCNFGLVSCTTSSVSVCAELSHSVLSCRALC
jgi:hypothetical protein